MLQFNVSGKILECGTDVELSLTRKNNAVNFADWELSRTVSFRIPATKTNNDIFALANETHMTGAVARVRIDCQLQYDGGNNDGYLYISQCDKSQYECVFVFGDLILIKSLMETPLRNCLDGFTDFVSMTDINAVAPSSRNIMSLIAYRRLYNESAFTSYYNPNINLVSLILKSVGTGVAVNGVTSEMQNVVCVVKSIADVRDRDVTISITERPGVADSRYIGIQQPNYHLLLQTVDRVNYVVNVVTGVQTPVNANYFSLYGYAEINITFPADFPDDYFLADWDASSNNVIFFGDYSFDVSPYGTQPSSRTSYGVPLAGRTVTLTGNPVLSIYDKTYYRNDDVLRGFTYEAMPLDSFDLVVTAKTEYNNANRVFAYDVVPDWTIADIIRKINAVCGKYISIDSGAITFNDYDFSNSPIIELKNVVKIEQIKRTFKDFARENYITFDNEPYVLEEEKLYAYYPINNDLLDAEKNIYTFEESGGASRNGNDVYIQDFDLSGSNVKSAQKNTLAYLTTGRKIQWLGYDNDHYIYNIGDIGTLCSKSTQLRVTCVMSLLEFNNIKDNTLIYYDGSKWIWTECTHSRGRATFTLQQFA